MPLRSFNHQGTEWTVWDTLPDASTAVGGHMTVAEGYGKGWLTFQCDAEKRRLAPVPPEWFELSEDSLVELLESASRVRRAPDMRF
jgi:hypothetical protein